jgi:hypothetical protein
VGNVGFGSGSAIHRRWTARLLHPNEPTFKALMRSSESGHKLPSQSHSKTSAAPTTGLSAEHLALGVPLTAIALAVAAALVDH